MIDLETELKELTPEDGYRLYARRLRFWHLCGYASCRRAQKCRGDPLLCCRRFAAWAKDVKDAAERERDARNPATQALRSELGQRLRRLAGTLGNDP